MTAQYLREAGLQGVQHGLINLAVGHAWTLFQISCTTFFEIDHRRLGVQIPHDLIGPCVLHQLSHAAVRVHEIAEDQGPCGTGLHAGRLDLAVPDLPFLVLGPPWASLIR